MHILQKTLLKYGLIFVVAYTINELYLWMYDKVSTKINFNDKFTSIVRMGSITSVMNMFLKNGINGIKFVFQYLFVDWITLSNHAPDQQELCDWLVYYLNQQMIKGKMRTANFGYESAHSINKMWYDTKKKESVQLRKVLFGWNILHGDIFLVVYVKIDNGMARSQDSREYCIKKMTTTLYNIFPFMKRKDFFDVFINHIKNIYCKKINTRQRVYKSTIGNGLYRPPILLNKLDLRNDMFIVTPSMKQIIDGVGQFLNSREEYEKKGFPYSRKICAYGPPGSGKSKLIIHIAGEYNLPLYYIDQVRRIEKLFDRVSNGIIVIEEIDKCISYCSRDLPRAEEGEDDEVGKKKIDIEYNRRSPSIKEWHSVLDNVVGDKVIVYVTTNNMHILKKINHGSIIRPGRMDHLIHVGYINKEIINELLQKYFETQTEYFGKDELNTDIFLTPADIINIIKESQHDIVKIKEMIMERNIENSKNPNLCL